MKRRSLDRFTGCLIGGAVGDALGYAVEFSTLDSIRRRFGEGGIRRYELTCGKAIISDDTQMTLFTANGLLLADTLAKRLGTAQPAVISIWHAYLDWLSTQESPRIEPGHVCWLYERSELHSQRAPGNTCVHALRSGRMGSIEDPINHSKGCGGIMRVAPVGLFYDPQRLKIEYICDIGAAAAAVTHGHPLGYISAEALVHIINGIVYGRHDDGWLSGGISEAIYDCRNYLMLRYPGDKHADQLVGLINKAIYLAGQSTPVSAAIAQLGEGWVGEEALAVAVYCCLKFPNSFEEAVIAAVNHSGDSDSTGAITGNIMGAYLGIDAIPSRFVEPLELRRVIEQIAEDLHQGCPPADPEWDKRYLRT